MDEKDAGEFAFELSKIPHGQRQAETIAVVTELNKWTDAHRALVDELKYKGNLALGYVGINMMRLPNVENIASTIEFAFTLGIKLRDEYQVVPSAFGK